MMSEKKFTDELISAYLDNELSADERTRVEESLMDSAEHRQLFNELKALRESLQLLPTYELGDDFSQRVLARAGNQAAGEDNSGQDTGAELAEQRSSAKLPPSRPSRNRIGVRYVFVWAAAVAAVLLVGLFVIPDATKDDDQSGGNSVAVKTGDDESDATAAKNSREKAEFENAAANQMDSAAEAPSDGVAEVQDVGDEETRSALQDDRDRMNRAPDEKKPKLSVAPTPQEPHAEKPLPSRAPVAEEKATPQQAVVQGGSSAADESTLRLAPGDPLLVTIEATPQTSRGASVELALRSEGFVERDASAAQTEVQRRQARQTAPSAPGGAAFSQEQLADLANQAAGKRELQQAVSDYRMLVVNSTAGDIESTLNSLKQQGFDIRVHREVPIADEKPRSGPEISEPRAAGRGARMRFTDELHKADRADDTGRADRQETVQGPQPDAPAEYEAVDGVSSQRPKSEDGLHSRTLAKEPLDRAADANDKQLRQRPDEAEGAAGFGAGCAGNQAAADSPQESNKYFYRLPVELSGQLTNELTADGEKGAAVAETDEAEGKPANGPSDVNLAESSAGRPLRVIFIIRESPDVEVEASASEREK